MQKTRYEKLSDDISAAIDCQDVSEVALVLVDAETALENSEITELQYADIVGDSVAAGYDLV